MLNRRIAISTMSILGSLAIMAGATFAFFSDTASSSNNTFGASNLNLQIANPGDAAFSEDVSATFNFNDIAPGLTKAATLSFSNAGTTSIAEIAMGVTTSSLVNNGNGDIRNVLTMRVFSGGSTDGNTCVGGTDQTTVIEGVVGNSDTVLTLNEFSSKTYDSLAIALPNPGSTGQVCIEIGMDANAGNIYQGDSVNAAFSFIAHQDATQ